MSDHYERAEARERAEDAMEDLRAENLRLRRALWAIAASHYGDEARALIRAAGLQVASGEVGVGFCDADCGDIAETALGEFNPQTPPEVNR